MNGIELTFGWWELTCHVETCRSPYVTDRPTATELPTCPSCVRELEAAPAIEADDPEILRRQGRAVSAAASTRS